MKMNGHATDQLVGSDRPTPVAEAVAVRVMPSDKESGEAALLNMPPLETNWKDDAALNEAACQAAAVSNDDAALSKAPPPADPAVEESMRFVDFVLTHAHEKYRLPLEQLYHQWQDLNEEHFAGDLKVPHLTIASGPPLLATSAISRSTGRRAAACGASSSRGRARRSKAASIAADAPAATNQAIRHDMPGRTSAEINIIVPAPAGM